MLGGGFGYACGLLGRLAVVRVLGSGPVGLAMREFFLRFRRAAMRRGGDARGRFRRVVLEALEGRAMLAGKRECGDGERCGV